MASERTQRQIDRLLDEAEEAFSRGDWEVLRERANRALLLDPANGDARNFVAAAERAMGGDVQAQPDRAASPAPPALEQSVAHHTSFANGRYQVKEFLGEGGKKRVYRAHDSVLERDVALAVIKTEGLDPTSRVRITREAQAMGRLGDHPHVLSIHDLGEDNGQPYMVLPLMPGGDVAMLLEKAEDHRLPLELAIDLAAQICRGLAFAHSKDIVHRDLKPGNIWLTSDGTAKIGDFGLAVAIDRSRLTQEGMMVGTVSYMPPEQAMGGDVTPQSDLYSLGAMLYEMVTGRPPFLGDDSVAIIGQHINTPPVAPTWHNPECPRALEALILRLLTKNPSERPESATDVLTALEATDLAASVEEAAPVVDGAHALDGLAGGVFVGRQQEMGELKAALEGALSGQGRLVTLVGEPGIGKTRTAQELATYAGLRRGQVLWGRCYEEQGVPPYWPWVQALRSYVRDRNPEELLSEMGAGAADIAEIVSDVREKLPGLQPPPTLEPEQARFRLFDSITTFLKSAARRQPLVIVLDDLHWADRPTLSLLEFVARELAGARLLLVGTYRDVDISRRHPLSRSLAELTRDRLFQRVLLRGLSEEDVGRFIEIVAGITPAPGLVEAVNRQTEGNPLFVTELVRLLVQEGELTPERSKERESWTVRIPEGVREVIGRRLDRLSERCNQTLTMASVIGREFSLDQLNRLIDDVSEDRLLEVLEEALGARVIEELPSTVGRYQFTHALIQETLLEELSVTRQARLHARIGEVLEKIYGPDAEAHAAELARHFAETATLGGTEKLVRYSLLAGKRALTTYAHDDALAHFQRALTAKEGQPVDGETAAILDGLGRSQAATLPRNEIHEAVLTLSRAFDYYAETGDVDRAVAIAEYPFYPVAGQRIGEAQLIARALELVPSDSHEAGRLLCRYGRVVQIEEGDFHSAQEAFGKALAIARREGDEALEMRVLADSANADLYQLNWPECRRKGLQAVELADRADEPYAEVLARYSAALAQSSLGDLEGLRSNASALLTSAERLRDRWWLASGLRCNGFVARLEGDWQAARQFNDRGLAVSPMEPRDLCTRALLEYEVGEFGQGEVYLERLLDVMRQTAPGPALEYAYPAMAIPVIACITGATDRLEVAGKACEVVLSSPSPTPYVIACARAGLALLAVLHGDAAAAEEQHAALEPHRGTTLTFSMTSVDRLMGLLSVTAGRPDEGASHFEEAITFLRKAGYRPELAWTCCNYADMLKDRDSEGDRRKAITLLDESLALSRHLGMRPLMERVLSRKMGLQGIDISALQTSIEAVVSAVEVERPNLSPHAAPDGTVTIMFTDIEGSTAMTERLGDVAAQSVLRLHNGIVREQIAASEGFEVKSQGDGFMVAFSSARRALECAIAIQKTLAAHNAENAGEPIRVRIGLHTGEAIKEGEDFFGKSVILAARIASQAEGEQVLVSSLLKALVESSTEFEFGEGRDVELKGLAGTHQVFEVSLP